jgi:hypothetical protein
MSDIRRYNIQGVIQQKNFKANKYIQINNLNPSEINYFSLKANNSHGISITLKGMYMGMFKYLNKGDEECNDGSMWWVYNLPDQSKKNYSLLKLCKPNRDDDEYVTIEDYFKMNGVTFSLRFERSIETTIMEKQKKISEEPIIIRAENVPKIPFVGIISNIEDMEKEDRDQLRDQLRDKIETDKDEFDRYREVKDSFGKEQIKYYNYNDFLSDITTFHQGFQMAFIQLLKMQSIEFKKMIGANVNEMFTGSSL